MEEYLAKFQPKKCIGCDAVGESTVCCSLQACRDLPAHYYCMESCKPTIGSICVVPRVECKKEQFCLPLSNVENSASLVCKCGGIFCLSCYSPHECFNGTKSMCRRCIVKEELVARRNALDSAAAASSGDGGKRQRV